MQTNSEVLTSYQVSLTRTRGFDSLENTGYTTYGLLVRDGEGRTLFEREDFHANRERVERFIGLLFDPEHLHELVEDYIDGCDDLKRADKRNQAGTFTYV